MTVRLPVFPPERLVSRLFGYRARLTVAYVSEGEWAITHHVETSLQLLQLVTGAHARDRALMTKISKDLEGILARLD